MSHEHSKMGTWETFRAIHDEDRRNGWILDQVAEVDVSLLKEEGSDVRSVGFSAGSIGSNGLDGHVSTPLSVGLSLARDQASGVLEIDRHGQLASSSAGLSNSAGQADWRIRWFPSGSGPGGRIFLVFRPDPATRLARLVHDLRTPLAAMVTSADRLTEADTSPAGGGQEAAAIARAGRGLLAQVESMLGERRDRPSAPPLRWNPVEVAAETVELLRPTARAKGLAITMAESGPVPSRPGDPTPFRRILVNLVGNAVKFSDRGTVAITLGERPDGLVVSVRDEGPGIEPALLPRLFSPGARGTLVSDRSIEGSGLGLANVHELVTASGGTVRIESAPGAGSTFTVTMPAAHRSARLDRVRVLLVDDGEDNRRLLGHLLNSAGATVKLAADGFAAASIARDLRPDVILLDLAMPGRDGPETLRILRSVGVNAPALALTASTDSATARRAIGAGFVRVLTKPIDRESLGRAIAEVLASRAAA